MPASSVPVSPGVPTPHELTTSVVLYTTPWCGFCRAAVALLRKRGIAYEEIDVMGKHAAREWLAEVTRQSTVPQVFVHGRSVGGYTELAALDDSGELARMLDTDT